jgi:hypothetical protein
MMSIAELLDQREYWYAREQGDLVCYRLDDMTPVHLANLRAWLMRNAEKMHSATLASLWSVSAFFQGEQAIFEIDRDIERLQEADPRAWIKEQPLVEEITRRLAGLLEQTHGG